MRRIVLCMQNYLFGDAISDALQRYESDFEVHRVNKPGDEPDICSYVHPFALLMEVSSCPSWLLSERLKIRDEVLGKNPQCKIVLLVDEYSERELAVDVRQKKKDGLIDQFIYGSISASYLTALMDTL